jgi:hypothetical protein
VTGGCIKVNDLLRKVIPALLLLLAPALQASGLDSSVIGLFPKDVSEFAYADLATARTYPWFSQFESQVVPVAFHNFERAIASPRLGINSHIDQVAWALVAPIRSSEKATQSGGRLAGVAVGQFDSQSAQDFLKGQNAPNVQVDDYTLYASGSGSGSSDIYFAFIDSNTIAFGPFDALRHLINVREGNEDNLLENEKMLSLIDQANGDSVFWGVLNSAATRAAIEQLVPEAARFPQSEVLTAKMTALLISVRDTNDDIEVNLQGIAASPEDAVILSQLMQAGVLMRKYQEKSVNGALEKVFGSVQISANGNELDISCDLTDDQLIGLIESNTFAGLS